MLHTVSVCIDRMDLPAQTKYTVCIWVLTIAFALTGAAIWSIVRLWCLDSLQWLVCFAGYPAFSAVFTVFFLSCRHPFHDGRRN